MTQKKNPSRRRALVAPAVMVVAAGASLAALSSGAWFTDSDSVTNNTFSTGSISLDATPDSAALTLSNMAPGDTVVAPLTVNNDGSIAFKYNVSGSATGALAPALQTTVKSGVTTCSTGGFDSTGTVVGAANTVLAGNAVIGSRPAVAAAGSEVLCVKVTLPGAATANTYQNTTANLSFVFDATQTGAP